MDRRSFIARTGAGIALGAGLLLPTAKPVPGVAIGQQLDDLLASYEEVVTEPETTEAEPPKPPRYHDWLAGAIPASWTVDANHLRLIADRLDRLTAKEFDRLAIFMPPRHAKTETVTVRYAVYRLWLAKQAGKPINLLVTGYSDRFARRLSRKIRAVAQEQGLALNPNKTATDEWETADGSLVMARGVGSPPTGVGFQLIIIDDPIKRREDADSQAFREKLKDWYGDDLYTRLEPGGQILLILTRWHHDDLGNHAKSTEPDAWTELKLAAIAEGDEFWEIPGHGTWSRAKGEPLWPARFTAAALERIRLVLSRKEGERSWQALYQQNPTPVEGLLFKVANLHRVKVLPVGLECLRRWDLAASVDGDYTAGVKMAGPDVHGMYYVVNVVRTQQTPELRNALIRETAVRDGIETPVVVPKDPGSAGIDAARAMVSLLAGFAVSAVAETGSKINRAMPFAAQVNGGMVALVEGEDDSWITPFVEELRQFPRGHDDQVDAASGAFNLLVSVQEIGEDSVA